MHSKAPTKRNTSKLGTKKSKPSSKRNPTAKKKKRVSTSSVQRKDQQKQDLFVAPTDGLYQVTVKIPLSSEKAEKSASTSDTSWPLPGEGLTTGFTDTSKPSVVSHHTLYENLRLHEQARTELQAPIFAKSQDGAPFQQQSATFSQSVLKSLKRFLSNFLNSDNVPKAAIIVLLVLAVIIAFQSRFSGGI